MKNHGIVTALLALVLIAGAAQAAAQAREQTASEQDATYAKELEIRDLLLEKGGQSALGIRVTVDRTKAILTGDVPGRPAQELAEEVAKSVDGIESVDNRLRIKPPSGAPPPQHTLEQELSDARLEAKVKRQINDEIGKWSKQIGVEAVDGVVSLRGTLPDANRKQLALDTAGKTKGVRRVIDLIKIKA
jgi:hyperosmotically inducible periplasmic protein